MGYTSKQYTAEQTVSKLREEVGLAKGLRIGIQATVQLGAIEVGSSDFDVFEA